jgi:hypothetical protein
MCIYRRRQLALGPCWHKTSRPLASGSSPLRSIGIWVTIDQHRTRTMAHLWRPIPRYSFYFGVRPGEEVRPVDEEQGYCLQVWRRGHTRCLCLLSEDMWFFFRPHHHATGEFPMHSLAFQIWADEFAAAHPEYDMGLISYGHYWPRD